MSIRVFGIIKLSDTKIPLSDQVQLSFFTVECAIKNKIGINMGGNVDQRFKHKFDNWLDKIPFELTDDPMDNNAELLFNGDGVGLEEFGIKLDTSEPLLSRMSRVQKFLEELYENNAVKQIILDINIEDNDFESIRISVNNFCKKILDLYKQEDNWTPSVRIIVM